MVGLARVSAFFIKTKFYIGTEVNKVVEKRIRNIFIIGIAVFIILSVLSISNTIRAYKFRRLCDQYRERITVAEDTNRRLAETVGQCQSICGDLEQSVDRNIGTAREAVETIEAIRIQVQKLENQLGGFDWDIYYQYWDDYFGLE